MLIKDPVRQVIRIPRSTNITLYENFKEASIQHLYENLSSILSKTPFYKRAENGTRTRDPNLGKVMLYQLSYFRIDYLFRLQR